MQTIIVDMTPGYRMPTIHFSQGDVGTQFAIDLRSRFGDSLPASPTVTIQATKPSGFGFTVTATSVTNGVAVFTTTAEMTDEAGRFPAEIKVVKDNMTLFSANFGMEGEANTHPEGTIDGSQETVIPELTQLVERVEDAASSVLDMTVEAETLAAGSQATYSYDEDTNTATFGIPQGEAGAGAAGVTANAYSSSATYAVGDYVIHNSTLYRCTTAITTAESFTAAHWTQVVLADDVCDLKSEINVLDGAIITAYHTLEPYLYKKNTYINTNGVDTSLNGYDTFRIPLNDFDIFHMTWDAEFWTGLTPSYIANVELSDNSRIVPSNLSGYYYFSPLQIQELLCFGKGAGDSDVIAIYITAKADLISNVHIAINKPCVQFAIEQKNAITADDGNSIESSLFLRELNDFAQFSEPYFVTWFKLNRGDSININKNVTGVTGKGKILDSSGNLTILTEPTYTASGNCLVMVYNNSTVSGDIVFTPSPDTEIVDDGKRLKFIAGVIRNSGDGWEYINDSGHEPLNLTSVSVDANGRIEIDYGFVASKVLSLVATPDETFAGSYTIGGSVGLDKTLFNVYALPKTIGGLVRVTTSNTVNVNYSNFSSGSFNTSTGEIRLYHDSLSGVSSSELFNIIAMATDYKAIAGSQGVDYVSLYLLNSSGNVVKSFGSDTSIYVTRQINSVFVDANNIINAGGNFWIYGVMEIDL